MKGIKDRNGNILNNYEKQEGTLGFLYGNAAGRILLKLLIRPFVSKLAGVFMDSRLSAGMIKNFIKKNNIDMSRYEEVKYKSFNDFFTRSLRQDVININKFPASLISPCDSKLSAYRADEAGIFEIKGSKYSLESMLCSKQTADMYSGGWCLIFRLCVDDYHRYCFFDDGSQADSYNIRGVLHTVNPIALKSCDIYKTNSRVVTVLKTENFGDAVQVEVGAMMVGRIKNINGVSSFKRGDEKGMFEFGGSTVVLLLKKDIAEIDDDILKNTSEGYETIVKIGEKIGVKIGGIL